MYNKRINTPNRFVGRKQILEELKKIGVTRTNLVSVYLFGSYYWGYANKESDIDLYVLLKKDVGIKQLDAGKISFRYISTLQETEKAIKGGSFSRFYVLNYASLLLIGKKISLPDYPKDKAVEYLESKTEDISRITQAPLKWGFLTLMLRVFMVNYLLYSIKSFELTAYEICPVLSGEEKGFLAKVYKYLFDHKELSVSGKRKIVLITDRLEEHIRENISRRKLLTC